MMSMKASTKIRVRSPGPYDGGGYSHIEEMYLILENIHLHFHTIIIISKYASTYIVKFIMYIMSCSQLEQFAPHGEGVPYTAVNGTCIF